MRRIFAQTRKELTQILRDRLALVLALVLPLGLLILLGSAISLTVTDLPIIVQDLDGSPISRDFTDAFRASVTFRVVAWPSDRQPQQAFLDNKARAALVIPEHFGRDMARGRNTQVQMLVDATDANTAKLVQGYAGEIAAAYSSKGAGAISGSGTTRDGSRRSSWARGFSCWGFPCFLRCSRRWRWRGKVNRRPSCRYMCRTYRRMNFCWGRSSRSC